MAADPDDLEAGDRRLLAALYRDDADDADDGLGDDERDRLAGWEGVRGALREARAGGFDDEPPAEGPASMAALMAAARAHAPTPKEGLWARLTRWMTPMIAHPALAGAAALVVVGGAAGVLYLRGKHKVARPPASVVQQGAAPTAPTPPSSPLTDGELGDVLGKRQPSERPGPARVDPWSGDEGAPGTTNAQGGESSQGVTGGRGPRGEKGNRPAPSSGPAPADPAALPIELETGGETEATGGAAPGGDGQLTDERTVIGGAEDIAEPAPPPPPPPPPPDKPTTMRTPPEPKPEPAKIVREATSADLARLEQLTAQARSAAGAGDCAKVTELSRQVLALDRAYHRDIFSHDRAISRCL